MADWHYLLDDTPRGPVGAKGIIDLADRGIIGPNTPIWRRGLKSWIPAGRVKGIRFPPADDAASGMAPMPEPVRPRAFSNLLIALIAGAVMLGTALAIIWPTLMTGLVGALTVLTLIGLPLVVHRMAERQKEPNLEEALHQSFETGHRRGRHSRPEVPPPWRGWNAARNHK